MKKIGILLCAVATITMFSCQEKEETKVEVKDYGLKTFSANLEYNPEAGRGEVAYNQQIYFSLSDSSIVGTGTYGTDSWTQFYLIKDSAQANFTSDVKNWELVFTSYTDLVTQFNATMVYPVTGVLINTEKNIKVGIYDYEATDSTSASNEVTNAFTALKLEDVSRIEYSSEIDAIGYDRWKETDATYTYVLDTTLFYIVKLENGETYKVRFVGFYGSSVNERIITIQYQLMQ